MGQTDHGCLGLGQSAGPEVSRWLKSVERAGYIIITQSRRVFVGPQISTAVSIRTSAFQHGRSRKAARGKSCRACAG